jgi:hypothetical protein
MAVTDVVLETWRGQRCGPMPGAWCLTALTRRITYVEDLRRGKLAVAGVPATGEIVLSAVG